MGYLVLTRRAVGLLAAFALLVVSTAAVAHGHLDTKPVNDSHCVLCMAAHGTTHAVVGPAITIHCAQVQTTLLIVPGNLFFSSAKSLLTHGRAPPAL